MSFSFNARKKLVAKVEMALHLADLFQARFQIIKPSLERTGIRDLGLSLKSYNMDLSMNTNASTIPGSLGPEQGSEQCYPVILNEHSGEGVRAMKLFLATILAVTLFAMTNGVLAIDKSQVEKKWHTPFDLYLTPYEACQMKTDRPDEVLFVDVRTRQEVHYTGIADQVDVNIPYQFDTTRWRTKSDGIHGSFRKQRNPDFEVAVENALRSRGLNKASPVILMCTSGSRSPRAARALHKAGFKQVYTQYQGFEGIKAKLGKHKGKRLVAGWRYEGLPWSYDLIATKMYFNFDPQVLNETGKKPAEKSADD